MAFDNVGAINHKSASHQKEVYAKVTGMPLAMAEKGRQMHVAGVRGKDSTKSFLQSLGFAEGAEVTLISEIGGDVIVNVKGTRVAISKVMATRILTV